MTHIDGWTHEMMYDYIHAFNVWRGEHNPYADDDYDHTAIAHDAIIDAMNLACDCFASTLGAYAGAYVAKHHPDALSVVYDPMAGTTILDIIAGECILIEALWMDGDTHYFDEFEDFHHPLKEVE